MGRAVMSKPRSEMQKVLQKAQAIDSRVCVVCVDATATGHTVRLLRWESMVDGTSRVVARGDAERLADALAMALHHLGGTQMPPF